MRLREKLTLEEKIALALELIKRERSLDEIRSHYRVSHTTAYKIRNAFLAGGRAALSGERQQRKAHDLEARVEALEQLVIPETTVRGLGRARNSSGLAG